MLSGVNELKKYIEPQHIPEEFGGGFVYDHRTWIRNRMVRSHSATTDMQLYCSTSKFIIFRTMLFHLID